jgi:hypothetical protein
VESLTFEHEPAPLVGNLVAEIQARSFGGSQPHFDPEDFLILRSRPVLQPAFDYWKSDAALLPLQERRAPAAEKLSARGFEQFQVAAVVDVIAEGAICVSDAVRVTEWRHAPA